MFLQDDANYNILGYLVEKVAAPTSQPVLLPYAHFPQSGLSGDVFVCPDQHPAS